MAAVTIVNRMTSLSGYVYVYRPTNVNAQKDRDGKAHDSSFNQRKTLHVHFYRQFSLARAPVLYEIPVLKSHVTFLVLRFCSQPAMLETVRDWY